MIPPFTQQVIGVFVRYAVVGAAIYLTDHYEITLTDGQISSVVTAIMTGLVPVIVAWSIRQKFFGRQKLQTSMASSRPMTEHEVEAMVRNPHVSTPSVNTPKNQLPSTQE